MKISQQQIQEIEALAFDGMFHAKYFKDPAYWDTLMLDRALVLKMQNATHKWWCLDIGSAIPYFARVARVYYGHHVTSIDIDRPEIAATSNILDCEFISHETTLQNPLPELPINYDLITMFGVNLRSITELEYGAILRQIFEKVVPGGRLVVANNIGYLDNIWEQEVWWFKFIPELYCTIHKRGNMITVTRR